MKLKYEFDTIEELHEAMKNLSAYHDCEKCHGKIVCISIDDFGNACCGYCHQRVNYPRLSMRGLKDFKENLSLKGKEKSE